MPARERTRSNGRTRGLGVVPILEARPGGAAQGRRIHGGQASGCGVLRRPARRLRGPRGARGPARAVRHRRARPAGGLGRADESAVAVARERRAPAPSRTSRRSARRSAARPSCRSSSASSRSSARSSASGGSRPSPCSCSRSSRRPTASTSLLVPRDRPHVHAPRVPPGRRELALRPHRRLVAVYCGLVAAAHLGVRSARLRIAAWIDRLLIPVFVAFSRMYRGMHHPLDVAGGALIGDRRDRWCCCSPAAPPAWPRRARAPAHGRRPASRHTPTSTVVKPSK